MSLVTLQRSPESSELEFDLDQTQTDDIKNENADDTLILIQTYKKHQHLIEKYFVVKDAALLLPKLNFIKTKQNSNDQTDMDIKQATITGDILIHLQEMVNLLRPQDIISVVIKLTSYVKERIRYLAIVETYNKENIEESCIIGFDIVNSNATIGLILPLYSNCQLILDGDGGFKFQSHESIYIFKPTSIQAMWFAYQYLNKKIDYSRKQNFYANGSSHEWIQYYASNTQKSDLCLVNEWIQREERTSQRDDYMTPYYDGLAQLADTVDDERNILMRIQEKIKEIMLSSKDDDYESMSSREIRNKLELSFSLNLDKYKKNIDAIIFQCYNQLIERATCVLEPYLYLGSEWNASDYDRLINQNVTHVLNISNEVDNFFTDTFKYLNIRVQDVETSDLLKEFDRTYKFINEAKDQSSACLVHCKMGISRSASVVIAYIMKETNKSLKEAYEYVKQKRSCINPNEGFYQQLETYESILNTRKSKYSVFEPQNESDILTSLSATSNNINRIQSTNDLTTTLMPMNSQTSSSSDLRRCSSMKFKESPKLDIKRTPSYLNEHDSVLFNIGQSPPGNVIVRKLAEDFMKTSSNTIISSQTNLNELESTLPSGLVRRQVESINFKSRPCTPEDDGNLVDASTSPPQITQSNLDYNLLLTQSSPDSKRCKIEPVCFSRESFSNCSKKVFEFLNEKLRDEEEQQQQQQQDNIKVEISTVVDDADDDVDVDVTNTTNTDYFHVSDNNNKTDCRSNMGKYQHLTVLPSKTN